MADWQLRLRGALDEYFAIIVIALIVAALLGGWVSYSTHAAPGTTTEERAVDSWQTTGGFNHSATVTEPNDAYPVGTVLTERPFYFTRVAPDFNGTYTFTYEATGTGDLSRNVTLELVLRGIDEDSEERTVLWETTRELRAETTDAIEPGEEVRVPFSVDMHETVNRTETIDEQLGDPPGQTEVAIRAVNDLSGTVNGRMIERTETHTLPIALEGGTYHPDNPGATTEEYQTTRSVTVERTYGPVRSLAAPLLFVGSLSTLAGLVVARHRRRFRLSPAERALLAYRDDRDDFDEWISTIKLPDDVFSLPRAEAASLGDLVDFAIDTDTSVVADPRRESYYVVHDGRLYAYTPPNVEEKQTPGEDDDSGPIAVDSGLPDTVGAPGPGNGRDRSDGGRAEK